MRPERRMPTQPHASSFTRHLKGLRPVSPFRPRKRMSEARVSRPKRRDQGGLNPARASAPKTQHLHEQVNVSHLHERAHIQPHQQPTPTFMSSPHPTLTSKPTPHPHEQAHTPPPEGPHRPHEQGPRRPHGHVLTGQPTLTSAESAPGLVRALYPADASKPTSHPHEEARTPPPQGPRRPHMHISIRPEQTSPPPQGSRRASCAPCIPPARASPPPAPHKPHPTCAPTLLSPERHIPQTRHRPSASPPTIHPHPCSCSRRPVFFRNFRHPRANRTIFPALPNYSLPPLSGRYSSGGGFSPGNTMRMSAPPRSEVSMAIVPPCLVTTCFTIARPSPEPGMEREAVVR